MKYTKANIILGFISSFFSVSPSENTISVPEKRIHFLPVHWPKKICVPNELKIAELKPTLILLQDRISPQVALAFQVSSLNGNLTIIPYNSNSAQPTLRTSAFSYLPK